MEQKHGFTVTIDPPKGSEMDFSASLEPEPKPKNYSVTVELPNSVDSTGKADAVFTLLHTACGRAFGRNDFMRAYCFEDGHAQLYVEDKMRAYEFDEEPLKSLDFAKIRQTLIDMKSELESPAGWKRKPTIDGDVLEKIMPERDLQTEVLTAMTAIKLSDFSPRDPRNASISSDMCNAHGHKKDLLGSLTEDQMAYLREQGTGPIDPEELGLDLSGLHRLRVNTKDAQYWLGEVLGIKGLDLSAPSQSHGRRA